MAHVAGYTVANDYAIRDYLENWYRPNLRVKNRDGATVLGPWLVDAADVDGAAAARAAHARQRPADAAAAIPATSSSTSPFLIEYLSAFMTLAPGDVILTGTPEGVVNVDVGDEVVCEIEGLGRLVNTDRRRRRVRPRSARRRSEEESHASRASDRRPAGRRPRATSRPSIPATQEVLAEVARGGAAEVDAAVAAAKAAFPAWARHARRPSARA